MELNNETWRDINLNVDSLWIMGPRAKGGKRENNYHGNFAPQIPNEMIQRYTQEGDVVMDIFMKGRAIIGHLQKNHHKLIQFFVYEKSNTVIYCVKCNKIQIWQETTAIDVSTLAWAYIDMLSLLANNIRVQSIVKNE